MYARLLLVLIAVAEVVNGQFCGRPPSFPSIGCSSLGTSLAYSGYPRPPFPYLGGLGGAICPGTTCNYGFRQGDPGTEWNGPFGAGSMGGFTLISAVPGAGQGLESAFGSGVEAGSAKGSSIGSGLGSGQCGGFNSATQSGQGGTSFYKGLGMTPGSFGGMYYQGFGTGGCPGFGPYGSGRFGMANGYGIQRIVNIGNSFPNTLVGPFSNSLGLMAAQGTIATSYNNPQVNSFQSSTQIASDPIVDNEGGLACGTSNNEQSERFPRTRRKSSCCSSKCKSYDSRGRRATT